MKALPLFDEDPSAASVQRNSRGPMDGFSTEETRRLQFHGSAQTLFGIWIVNVFLTLLTLGVYYFWAKVRIREYLLSQTSFEGDRFAYHGTGTELLIGWIKAMLCVGIPY